MPLGPILFLHKCVAPHAVYVVIPELPRWLMGPGYKVPSCGNTTNYFEVKAVIQHVQNVWKLTWARAYFIWNLLVSIPQGDCCWIFLTSLCWLFQHLQPAGAPSLLENISAIISACCSFLFGISFLLHSAISISLYFTPIFSRTNLALEIAKWDQRADLGSLAIVFNAGENELYCMYFSYLNSCCFHIQLFVCDDYIFYNLFFRFFDVLYARLAEGALPILKL